MATGLGPRPSVFLIVARGLRQGPPGLLFATARSDRVPAVRGAVSEGFRQGAETGAQVRDALCVVAVERGTGAVDPPRLDREAAGASLGSLPPDDRPLAWARRPGPTYRQNTVSPCHSRYSTDGGGAGGSGIRTDTPFVSTLRGRPQTFGRPQPATPGRRRGRSATLQHAAAEQAAGPSRQMTDVTVTPR